MRWIGQLLIYGCCFWWWWWLYHTTIGQCPVCCKFSSAKERIFTFYLLKPHRCGNGNPCHMEVLTARALGHSNFPILGAHYGDEDDPASVQKLAWLKTWQITVNLGTMHRHLPFPPLCFYLTLYLQIRTWELTLKSETGKPFGKSFPHSLWVKRL